MTEDYLTDDYIEIKNCTCGGNPVLRITPISHVYFVSCSECGKETMISASPIGALEEWNEINRTSDIPYWTDIWR